MKIYFTKTTYHQECSQSQWENWENIMIASLEEEVANHIWAVFNEAEDLYLKGVERVVIEGRIGPVTGGKAISKEIKILDAINYQKSRGWLNE